MEQQEVYFCDNCESRKDSLSDGKAYKIKVSTRPKRISNICPACRPNVVAVWDDDWKDF